MNTQDVGAATTGIKPLITPTVNLNGTDRESLVRHRLAVVTAIDGLVEALYAGMPHGRDYQTMGDIPTQRSITDRARSAFHERIEFLREMRSQFFADAESIHNQ